MNRAIAFALALVTSVSVARAQMADNADSQWFPRQFGQAGVDYLPDLLVVKLKQEHRGFFENNVSAWAQNARQWGLGAARRAFPEIAPPRTPLNALGLPNTDLSLIYEIPLNGSTYIPGLCAVLAGTGLFEYAEPMPLVQPLTVPTDPGHVYQYFFSRIRAYDAYDITTGDPNVVIAVVDGGTNFDHADLTANLYYNYADPIDGVDNDGDGYIDNYRGWDVGDNDNDPSYNVPADNYSGVHGTAMCGIIGAANNNGIGASGLGWNCKYLPVKVVQSGAGWTRSYQGVVYAARAGADIINCSWGGNFESRFGQDVMRWAVLDMGKLVIAAAGNSNNSVPVYPAAFEEVLAVTATDINDERWSGSSYYERVDLSAPGDNIYRSYGYASAYGSGSSEASAVTSGAAGIVKSQFPWMTALQLGARLKATSVPIDHLPINLPFAGKLGHGRLDLKNAVSDSTGPWLYFLSRNYENQLGAEAFLSGDSVSIRGYFLNALNPSTSALKAVLTHNSPYVQLLDSVIHIGVLGMMQSYYNLNTPFRFVVKPGCPTNHLVHFRVSFLDTAAAGHTDFFLYLQPDHYNWTFNNIHVTLGNNGRLGFSDAVTVTGIGFKHKGSANFLMEQYYTPFSLMLGHNNTVSNATLSSPLSGCCPLATDNHFISTSNFKREQHPGYLDERIAVSFNDAGATSPIGIEVTRIAYGDTSGSLENALFLDHVVQNNNPYGLKNIYIGYYLDQNIPDSLFFNNPNRAGWDATYRLGWQTSQTGRGAGLVLLGNNTVHYYAFDVGGTGGSIAVTDGFTQAEKWQVMTGGVLRSLSNLTDVAQYIGTVIDTLGPNACTIVSMALVVGENLTEMQQNAQLALNYAQQNINVWTGKAGNPNWHDPLNWSAGIVPTSSHRVYIVKPSYSNGFDPIISQADGYAGTVETRCGAKLQVTNGKQLIVGP